MTVDGKLSGAACRTKPGTPLGERLCQADQETKYSASDIDGLLDMLSEMDDNKRDEIIMHCDENTRNRLFTCLSVREFDQCNIKQMKSLHEEGRTPEKKRPTTMKGNATDAVFSSEAANNYYQAIGYRVGPSSVLTHDNDDESSKNISWKGVREDEDTVMSAGTRTTKSTEILTSFQEVMADAMKKGKTPNEVADYIIERVNEKRVDKRRTEKPTEIANFQAKQENEKEAQMSTKKLCTPSFEEGNDSFEQRKMSELLVKDGLKNGGKTPAEIAAFILSADDERMDMKVCKSPKETTEYLMEAEKDKCREEEKTRLPVKALVCPTDKVLPEFSSFTDHLKVPSSTSVIGKVAGLLMKRDNKKRLDKRRTQKLLVEALEKNMTPTEIANYLLKAEQANKHEKQKEAQKRTNEICTPSYETKISEQLVKDALARGGTTPAEIAAFILRADEERKVQELVYQALKVCKTPQEIAKYLMKAEEQKLMEKKKRGQGNALPESSSDTNHKVLPEFSSVTDHLKGPSSTSVIGKVAGLLMKRDNKKRLDKRRTQKLLVEALEKNTTPTEIANYLLKAEQANKHEKQKEAQKRTNEICTPSYETKISEQLVKDALARGGTTPAEIAAFILRADEERKVQELVYQALKVCKTPQEIAEYLLKAEEQKLMEEKKKGQGNALPESSSDTNHLKSVSSMASVLSSECSIGTEIVANGNKQKGEIPKKTRVASVCSNDVDLSSNATSKEKKKKKKKPLTSIILGKKTIFIED